MTQRQSPGVPQLLRVLNDRAALSLLFAEGPQTRAQLAAATSLSKVTASQMVERLESRGLIEIVGTRSGNRGPNAQVYDVVSSYAHVVGVDVGPNQITAACADLSATVVGHVELDAGAEPHVDVVRRAIAGAVDDAGISLDGVRRVMMATPGLIDPRSNDVGFAWDLPTWHRGLRENLEKEFSRPVVIENDVNLAAMAEHRVGAAHGVDNFVYVWFGRGLGLGVVLAGKLHRGATGGAGEIGYLPVPGVSLPDDLVERRAKGSFQKLAGADAVCELGREHGITGDDAATTVATACADPTNNEAFLEMLAHRMSLGVASACSVLDPSLVVLGGEVGYAGGQHLASRVGENLPKLAPMAPSVVAGTADSEPVLRGAIQVSLDAVRDEIFAAE